jgi:Zn-dependent M16 (insulinase) family peptidase
MSVLYGFEELRRVNLAEINSQARHYRHVNTGAELLSIVNDDENKAFGITFRTPPSDSTGIAHILEHSVLCGSRKFPVKDPFMRLAQGSLNTFLNAMTFADKTTYPTASQNLQDFYNLIDVYIDAVLHPRLTREIFEQEGWHYELESPEKPLIYQGVVFNEMKGAYSSPDALLFKLSQQAIFPDNIYSLDSGGDPAVIPDLTYEAFRAFHKRYYHPSNARIYFYGDDDPQERLRLLEARLSDFSAEKVDSGIALQPRFRTPRRVENTYAAGEHPETAKSHVTLNWMLDEVREPEVALALTVLRQILTGTPASPLHKALIDSGLGEEVISTTDFDFRQPVVHCGLKGIDAEDAGMVETLILDTLESLATKGFEKATVEAALNTIEFRLRENNSGRFPRGLSLMLRTLTNWLYDLDPLDRIAFQAPLARVKARITKGERMFEELARTKLIDNLHRATVLLRPDPGKAAREAAEERERLDAVHTKLSRVDLDRLAAHIAELKRWQETPDKPEAIATIPSLKLSDLPKRNGVIPVDITQIDGVEVLTHDLFTNGILYLDLAFDLHALPGDKLPLVEVLGRALLETGAGAQDFVALSEHIGRSTGGIRASTFISAMRGNPSSVARLVLRAKVVPDKADELITILRNVLLSAHLEDHDRVLQIVLEEKASAESNLAPLGHLMTGRRICAQFSEDGWVQEQVGGLSYLLALRTIAARIEEDWASVAADLVDMYRRLVTRARLVVNVTADAGTLERFAPKLQDLVSALPAAPFGADPAPWPCHLAGTDEGFTIPAKVNYVAKGGHFGALGFKPAGSALAVVRFLATTYLWDKVRLQGGAYGGTCRYDRLSGIFAYQSYRDPNLMRTIDVFDKAAEHLRTVPLGNDDIKRSIIGTIGDIDTYLLPDAKGLASLQHYLAGDNEAARQQMRDEVLLTTPTDFRAFSAALTAVAREGRVVVLGPESAIGAANAERGGWLKVKKIL